MRHKIHESILNTFDTRMLSLNPHFVLGQSEASDDYRVQYLHEVSNKLFFIIGLQIIEKRDAFKVEIMANTERKRPDVDFPRRPNRDRSKTIPFIINLTDFWTNYSWIQAFELDPVPLSPSGRRLPVPGKSLIPVSSLMNNIPVMIEEVVHKIELYAIPYFSLVAAEQHIEWPGPERDHQKSEI